MKKRSIILIIAGAVITLSFTLAKVTTHDQQKVTRNASASEPVGGLAIEDKP